MPSCLLPHPLERQNIPDGCIIPCYPRNIKFPTENPADSCPTCPTVSTITWPPHLALFISIYWCPQPLPNSPALLHTPALPSGTLSRLPNLPTDPKDPLVILTSPGTHSSIPNSHIFLAGGEFPVWIYEVCWEIPRYWYMILTTMAVQQHSNNTFCNVWPALQRSGSVVLP